MKIVTFRKDNRYGIGALVSGTEVMDLTSLASEKGLTAGGLLECFDFEHDFLELAAAALRSGSRPLVSRSEIVLCAPVPRPGKIVCIGLNYRDHAAESGLPIPPSPIIFSKFPSCTIGSGDAIRLPAASTQVDYEAELAFVIGRRAKQVRLEDAFDHILGYTNFNDVSARDFQFSDGQWTRGKACDTFAPMGEFIATKDELADPHALRIRFRLNGVTLQDSNTRELIFKIPELVEFLSRSMTLEPGDVIATGTPPGVGFARRPPVFLQAGDRTEVEIEGLGILTNTVVS